MGTIAFPNAAPSGFEISQAPQNAFAEYARVAQLQAATAGEKQQTQQRSAMAPLEQQQGQQQIEMQRRQMADQDALTKTMSQYDPAKHTLADIPKLITSNGGSGQAALSAQSGLITQRQNLTKLSDDQFANEQKKSDLMAGVHDQVSSAPPEQKQQTYSQGLQKLAAAGVDVSKEPLQYPGDDAFAQHLAPIRLHSAIVKEANEDRETAAKESEAATKQQVADQDKWTAVPDLGVRMNKITGETQPIQGAQGIMPAKMAEGKYLAIDQKMRMGQPLSAEDKAFHGSYEHMKELVPQFNINQNASGAGMIPSAGSGQPGAPGGPPPTIDKVPGSIQGRVKAIMDYRDKLPAAGRNNPVNTAISYWVNKLDPEHDETNFPARNKLITSFTSGPESKQINAVNTALGHVGVLSDAIDALNNSNVPALNAIANKLGVAIGNTPATTVQTIVHRVGPELAAAYIQGGGGEGERGTTADDFSLSKGNDQLKANVAVTAKLLRSKIGSLENQYKQTMGRDDFQDRFITPEAKGTLQKLSPQGGAGGGAAKVATLQHIADYAKAKGIAVGQAQQEFKQSGYTIQ